MANEVENLSSNIAALTKQLEKNNAAMLMGKKTLNDQKKDFENILESAQDLETSEKNQNNYLKEMKDSMSEVLKSSIKMSSTLATIGTTAFAANLVKDLVDLDNRMTAVSVRMGKGHTGIKELKASVNGLQKEFGTSYENAVMLVEELAKDKYVGNVKEAAAGIDLFSRASGVASSEILELTNNLSKMGGLSTGAINSIYAEMIKVQQTVGISDKGMNALARTVNDVAFNMAAVGKSSDDIKRMTTNTTALVGAMEKVGVSAQRSTELISQLTDPDRIEDNIMLYSQLGISIQDAMSGELDSSALGGQFKEMADRITSLGPIAGSSFAKSMGLSYKEVTRMSKMEAGEIKDIADQAATPEEQALETMKNLEKSTEGIGKKFETSFNKLEGTLKGLPMSLLIGLSIIAPLLIRQGKKIFHKIFDKKEIQASVTDAIIPAMGNSVKKAGEIVKGGINQAGNAIKGNIGQWFDSTTIGGFFGGIDTRVDALMARFNKESFADKFLASTRKNRFDDVEAQLVNIDAQKEKIFSGFNDIGIENPTFDENTGKLNKPSTLDAKQLKIAQALEKSYNNLNKAQKALEKRKAKLLTKDQALEDVAKATANLEEKKKAEEEAAIKYAKAQKAQREKALDIDVQIAKLKKDMNDMDDDGKEAIKKKIEALKDEKDAAEEVKDAYKNLKKAKGDREGAEKDEEDAKAKADGMSDSKWKNGFTKIFAGLGNKFITAFNKTELGKNLAERKGQGGAGVAKAIGKTALVGVAKGGLGILKGIGKGIGGILKSVGPMALVMSILGRLMDKIKEPLEGAMDTIVNNLSPIVKAVMPALQVLMNTMAKHIMPLVLNILSGILTVVHWILDHTLIPIMKLLSHIPGLKGTMDGLVETLDKATGPEVSEGLKTAANQLSETSVDLKSSSENLDDAANAEEDDGPRTIEARGATMVAVGTTTNTSQTENSSSTSSTEEKLKEEKEEREKYANNKNIEGIGENTSVLPKILNALENIIEVLTSKDTNIYDEAAPKVELLER